MTAERYISPHFFTGLFIPDWLFDLDITLGATVCYAKLARLAQQKGHAYPTVKRLATLLKVSKRQAGSYLQELKTQSLVEVRRTGRANNYHLLWHPSMGEAPIGSKLPIGDSEIGSKLPIRSEADCLSDRQQASTPFIERTPTENTKEETSSKKKKDPPDPNVQVFIQWWCTRYKAVCRDDYLVQWGKEGGAVKALLKTKSIEEVKKRAEKLLTTNDKWLKNHRTIPMLASKWNELNQIGMEQDRPSPGRAQW